MGQNFLKSDRIRVLVNGIHAKSGGGVTYLRNILPLLSEDPELEVHLFLHRDQYELFGTLDERIRLHLLSYRNGFFANAVWEQIALPILARIMSVDVTVSPANFGPLFAPAQIIMLRNSLAVAGKENRPIKRLYWGGLTLMTALSLFTCRRAIAVSDYARKALTFGLGEKFQNKVTVVHHGVSAIYQHDKSVVRKNFLLAVSDIYVQKNLHTLIRALASIREAYPDIILKIAGKAIDEGYLQELYEVLDQTQMRGAVEFMGEQNTHELLTLYQECKLFVFPSTVETFGNPLVEAMACAAPIISSNTAAMPEVLGEAGHYFNPLDAQDMAQGIMGLLDDDAVREDLSERAYQRSHLFSRKTTVKNTAEVIKSVVPDRYIKIGPNEVQTPS
jgi:glycosyltransferase involved in cell wall biosynthesis